MDTTITLTNQTNLFLTGVVKVYNVSPTEIVVMLGEEKLCILGSGMEVQRVDLENKVIIVEGRVYSMKFLRPKQPMLKRIFK